MCIDTESTPILRWLGEQNYRCTSFQHVCQCITFACVFLHLDVGFLSHCLSSWLGVRKNPWTPYGIRRGAWMVATGWLPIASGFISMIFPSQIHNSLESVVYDEIRGEKTKRTNINGIQWSQEIKWLQE